MKEECATIWGVVYDTQKLPSGAVIKKAKNFNSKEEAEKFAESLGHSRLSYLIKKTKCD